MRRRREEEEEEEQQQQQQASAWQLSEATVKLRAASALTAHRYITSGT
jgi:hypothetical protein